MENSNQSINILQYFKKHWFQIIIVSFLLFVLMRKDFSFQFNMNNPDNVEQPSKRPAEMKQKNKELLTQKVEDEKAEQQKPGLLDRFGLSFIGGGVVSAPKSELSNIDEKTVEAYLKRFAHVAISERKKYGVPSSIILANGLFHSFAGSRDIAQSGNNHFGIGCSSDWQGDKLTFQNHCYRIYENAWMSFRDHSLFLTSGKYSNLLQFDQTDYKSWAKELEKRDFSEFPDLEKNLIEIIEKYGLSELDYQ
jgi:flagellum-specific peptidoglycan hydrolase FlgJ